MFNTWFLSHPRHPPAPTQFIMTPVRRRELRAASGESSAHKQTPTCGNVIMPPPSPRPCEHKMYMLSLTWQLSVLKCRSPDLWPQIYVSEFLQWSSRKYSPNISYSIQYRSGMIFNFGRTCCSFARMTQQKILIFSLDYLRFPQSAKFRFRQRQNKSFQSAYAYMLIV